MLDIFLVICLLIVSSHSQVDVRQVRVCDNAARSIQCQQSQTIYIYDAENLFFPGVPFSVTCDKLHVGRVPCKKTDASTAIKTKCHLKTSCSVSIVTTETCPASSVRKALDITYACKTNVEKVTVCDSNTRTIQCALSTQFLYIYKATNLKYASVPQGTTCPDLSKKLKPCSSTDALSTLKNICAKKQSCVISGFWNGVCSVTTNQRTALELVYTCVTRAVSTLTTRVCDNGIQQIRCPGPSSYLVIYEAVYKLYSHSPTVCASYASPCSTVSKTADVQKACDKKMSCTLKSNNAKWTESCTGPHSNMKKSLDVKYACSPKLSWDVVCESTTKQIQCQASEILYLYKADLNLYSRTTGSAFTCNAQQSDEPCWHDDDILAMQKKCYNKQACTIGPAAAWDVSCPGEIRTKALEVSHTCVPNAKKSVMCDYLGSDKSIVLYTKGFPFSFDTRSACTGRLKPAGNVKLKHALLVRVIDVHMLTSATSPLYLFICQNSIIANSGAGSGACEKMMVQQTYYMAKSDSTYTFNIPGLGTNYDKSRGAIFSAKVISGLMLCVDGWIDDFKTGLILAPTKYTTAANTCRMIIKPKANDIRLRFIMLQNNEAENVPLKVSCGSTIMNGGLSIVGKKDVTYCQEGDDLWLAYSGGVEITLDVKDISKLKPFWIEYELTPDVKNPTPPKKPDGDKKPDTKPPNKTNWILTVIVPTAACSLVIIILVTVTVCCCKMRNKKNEEDENGGGE